MSLKERILQSRPGDGQAAIFYLGQESVLIKCGGKVLLFDPYLTDSVDRKVSTEEMPWKRNYPAPIEARELDFVDYVFCSHSHEDHTDPESIVPIAAASPQAKFVGSRAVCEVYASECGLSEERMILAVADQPMELEDGVSVMPIPAAHEALNPDGMGGYRELGFIVEAGGMRFYHAGDCCPYDGLVERLQGIDVGFMPINGRDYFRLSKNIIGNFDSAEAVQIAAMAGIELLVPLHFDLYAINDASPAHFVDCIGKFAPRQHYHIFAPGEKMIYEK